MSKTNTHEEWVRYVRQIGESLIKNAESIVGSEEYLSGIYISAEITNDGAPVIDISKRFYPEQFVKENVKK